MEVFILNVFSSIPSSPTKEEEVAAFRSCVPHSHAHERPGRCFSTAPKPAGKVTGRERLGIFAGADLALATPPAAADWSHGGEVNRTSAVNQNRATESGRNWS